MPDPDRGQHSEHERHHPGGSHLHQQQLRTEDHAHHQHEAGELFDEVVDRVEHLAKRQRHVDECAPGDFGALDHGDHGVEAAGCCERSERTFQARFGMRLGQQVQRLQPGQADQQNEQEGKQVALGQGHALQVSTVQ
ncbi:hypothetical protein [Hydrogenophaga sp.]|uniref:hypothetical protein n=1 Tax=Hydrogenophaga sp. TaxID=1904254 RepID=UPI00272045FE|nr:hypothetical protein [Hydrogenophaga sp.]MDO9134832.1 hypothetical protein [Hydrogenophaga sp.]